MEAFSVAANRILTVDGHDFLFLVDENAIFEIDRDTRALFTRCRERTAVTRDQFLASMEGPVEDAGAVFDGLLSRRLLVPSVASRQRPMLAPRTAIPLTSLVLNVTDDCNFGCLYCYQDQQRRPRARNRAMTPRIAQQAIDFLMEHSAPARNVTLVFFGGEPFLNLPLLSFAAEYGRSRAAAQGKEVSFSVTTNGSLLEDDAIRFVSENDVTVTVSIDGDEEVHDRHRRFRDGTPSYQAILPKIRRLLEAPRRRPVVARVTALRGAEDLPLIIDHLLDLGFSEAGVAPVTTADPRYQMGDEDMGRLLEEFEALSRRFTADAMRGALFGFSNLIDLLVALHEGEVKNHPCGAGLGLFSVDPDGRLYPCQRLTGDESLCMGDVHGRMDWTKVGQFRKDSEIGRLEPCTNCWARVLCAGGCHHEALVRQGAPTRPNLHYCEWIKSWITMGLETYCRIALKRPGYLDQLAASRRCGEDSTPSPAHQGG
jgi:uncharacterized protein